MLCGDRRHVASMRAKPRRGRAHLAQLERSEQFCLVTSGHKNNEPGTNVLGDLFYTASEGLEGERRGTQKVRDGASVVRRSEE